MKSVTLKAYGKINIGLDVTGRREDGYHLVKMIMQTVGIYDVVTVGIEEGSSDTDGVISLTCSNPDVPLGSSNIAWKAARRIMDRYGIGCDVQIDIRKNIPMAAGMAGGSTDAAAVILAMNELLGLMPGQAEMDEIALKLGADVPFCLRRGTYLSQGIGEILSKLPDAPGAHVLIVNPPFEVSTAAVYKALDSIENPIHPDIDRMCGFIEKGDVHGLASCMGNILQDVTAPEHPVITEISDKMRALGAFAGMMTGSGPTVFGFFDDRTKAEEALEYFESNTIYGKCFLTEFIR